MESVDSVAITCINSFQDEGNSKFSLIYMLYNYKVSEKKIESG